MANRLINEQSLYLLQHAHNPVDWYPWGDEAFEKAKKENKPVLVSIGYAACHWCHVMERESFENEQVAAYMNEHFVCIKVDREEHPDVDHLYMDAIQAISGSGGWPLNAFVTPDRVPFYGGTYFPPTPMYNRLSWTQLLQKMNEIWHTQPDEVATQATQMVNYLKQASQVGVASKSAEWNKETCRKIADDLLRQADKEKGGFGRAPKFPGTMAISYLLEHYHYTGYKPALDHALLSLDAMSDGGIYDQLGGGFARYATDDEWLAPHFEKMLYDNALLILSLCDAYSITKENRYRNTIVETINFVNRELLDPSGGFYSALDADSEGVEGKFYTWTWEDWQEAVGDEPAVADYFGVTMEGNWEEVNILHVTAPVEAVAAKYGLKPEELEEKILEAKKKLWKVREGRIRPAVDDKCLLSWNALMNMALTKAGVVLDEAEYLQQALNHAKWMVESYTKGSELKHVWKGGEARIMAHLDDYAYLIQAFIQLGTATEDYQWIVKASEYMESAIGHFQHESGNFFYYSSEKKKEIPVRKVDLYDGALPSANAVMAQCLLQLGMCMERGDWMDQGYMMLKNMSGTVERYSYSFSWWAIQLQRYVAGLKMVISSGIYQRINMEELKKIYVPECLVFGVEKEINELPILADKFFLGENYIFVCTQNACLPPVKEVADVLSLIESR